MELKNIFKRYKKKIIVASIIATSFVSFSFVDEYFEVSKNLDIFTSLFRDLNIYYVDPIDPAKLMKKGIDDMLSSLDPYTDFIPETEKEDYRYMTTGQYGGIGAVIKLVGDYSYISDPYEGYPAQKNGLIAGDKLLEIDGKSIKGKKTDEVSRMLKGTPGTQVKILFERKGEKQEKTITREEIKVKSVPYYGFISDSIGYIKLNSFTESSSIQITKAINDMKESGKLKGLVFDLRGNPGGLLNEAVNISNIFVTQGEEIVSTKGKIKEYNRIYKALNMPVDKSVPLAVLVNSSSASASEIVSGSLQDLDRGIIIGQRTFGKGLVQTTRQLSYNTQVKITSSKYYIPSGRCIQALDYSHRNEDGSVGKIPDSLVTAFKTRNGRIVYNGGGVLPDVITTPVKLSNISVSLLNKNVIFDFATDYFLRNAKPLSTEIKLTESDFKDFQTFIADKEYDYTTKTEKSLEDLKKNAGDEKYLSVLEKDIDGLKSKLNHDKKDDVLKNKQEIISLLEDEIASRYFYQPGRVRESLTHDLELEKAIQLLKDSVYYNGILKGTIKANVETDTGKL